MLSEREPAEVSTETVLLELKRAIGRLKYGTITMKIHEGRITQVEITEKRRFDAMSGFERGDGI